MNDLSSELEKALEGQPSISLVPQEGDEEHLSRDDRSEGNDPLADIKIDALIKHPNLGKELQAWADRRAAAQARGKEEALRKKISEELRPVIEQRVREEDFDKYVQSLSQEELAERISQDRQFAADYSRSVARSTQAPAADIQYEAKRQAYALQIATYTEMLDSSDLSDEEKESLQPENFDFANKGEKGLVEWTTAILKAISGTSASIRQEASRQSRRAEEDEERTRTPRLASANGYTSGPLPDLIKNDSSVLLESAFAERDRSARRSRR